MPKATTKDKIAALNAARDYQSIGHLPKSEIEKLLEEIEATKKDERNRRRH